MNLSSLITRIKIDCGIYAIALPFDNADEIIKDIIIDITRPVFSKYCPTYEKIRFDLNKDLKRIDKYANYETYLLPDIFHDRELLYVKDVNYDESDSSDLGYWGGGIPIMQGNMIKQAILSNAAMSLSNKTIPKITFDYVHPRKVTLYNVLSSSKIVFELALEHDKSLASITPTSSESFYKLAILDVKSALYEVMKEYTDINTAYGNISLKLDNWASAADKREQLLNEWEDSYHIDTIPFTYA